MDSEDKGKIMRRVVCTMNIPAKSFAEVGAYSSQKLTVTKPNEDNVAVVIVPEAVNANKVGLAHVGGIHVIERAETIYPGNRVGAKTGSWLAKKGGGGKFLVLGVLGNDLIVRSKLKDFV